MSCRDAILHEVACNADYLLWHYTQGNQNFSLLILEYDKFGVEQDWHYLFFIVLKFHKIN